jgi:RNA polymerase sigma factor (sigma-70 family)
MATTGLNPRQRQRHSGRCRFILGHNKRVTDRTLSTSNTSNTSDSSNSSDTDRLSAWVHTIAAGSSASDNHNAQRAWSALYDHTVQRVHAMVRRYVHEDSAAQEVTQDVFYQVWAYAARFDATRGSVMAWLLTMARSRALDAWRKHQAQPVHFDSDIAEDRLAQTAGPQTPVDVLTEIDSAQALHTAMAQVPAAARQMISLAFFQGLTHAEISAHMQVPLGTVKTTIRRALLTLREHLQLSLPIDAPVGMLAEEPSHG